LSRNFHLQIDHRLYFTIDQRLKMNYRTCFTDEGEDRDPILKIDPQFSVHNRIAIIIAIKNRSGKIAGRFFNAHRTSVFLKKWIATGKPGMAWYRQSPVDRRCC